MPLLKLSLRIILFIALYISFAQAQIQFEDVSQQAGILYWGKSFGASWGDENGDGWPDLYVGNHNPAILYINNADGSFTQSTDIFTVQSDLHGAAWADFDNDGDQDLLQVTGADFGTGSIPKLLYVNDNDTFKEKGTTYGLSYPLGRGRSPLWFDWNNDGLLDVFFANDTRSDGQAPSAIFTQQQNHHFVNDTAIAGITTGYFNYFAQITGMTLQNRPSLIIHNPYDYPDRIYEYDTLPYIETTYEYNFPFAYTVTDAVIADFNGDLLTDFFYLNSAWSTSAVLQTVANKIIGGIHVNRAQKGFKFKASGDVTFSIYSQSIFGLNNIYIGEGGAHPVSGSFPGESRCTLSPGDSGSQGIYPHVPGVDSGVYIGYNPASEFWEFYESASSSKKIFFSIDSIAEISELTNVGFVNTNGELSDFLLIQTPTGISDNTVNAGLSTPTACESVVAADFDNDMDMDLYLVCAGTITNLPSILYENLGNGTFQEVVNAGGAVGSSEGRGESAVTADYDRDGFIDIFITNGRDTTPNSPFGQGPHQLFHNVGNNNHWLEIDLEGVVSNRDGIGARVLATAGAVTQLREQGGGMHKFSQNHPRLHFGLAANTMVEKLIIQWPSGIEQEINNISANQIFHAVELDINTSISGSPYSLTVDFTANSRGYYNPLSYEWDFDGDQVIDSIAQNPSFTYSSPGTYLATLSISDADGRVYKSSRRVDVCIPFFNPRIPAFYSLIQDAYNNAEEGDIIQGMTGIYTGDININRPVSVTFNPGYSDCYFTYETDTTVVNGNITVSDGTLIIGGGYLQIGVMNQ